MKPMISIIIPCYNSGKYLPEALESLDAYHNQQKIEIVIVDDGSSDKETVDLLKGLNRDKYKIIYQDNKGPAAARNTGAFDVNSEFLLFLDSDNKIAPGYIDKGIDVLQKHPEVAVAYGNASFFGDTHLPRFSSKPFDIYSMLIGNYIDVCAVVRREAFKSVGGFDESRILFGHEDWELWIRMYSKGWKFHHINENLFEYRVRDNSLLMQKSESENMKEVLRFVYKKHLDLFIEHYYQLYYQYQFYTHDKAKPFRTFIKNTSRKYFRKNGNDSAG